MKGRPTSLGVLPWLAAAAALVGGLGCKPAPENGGASPGVARAGSEPASEERADGGKGTAAPDGPKGANGKLGSDVDPSRSAAPGPERPAAARSRRWLTRRELGLGGKPVGLGELEGPAGARYLGVLLEDPGRIELRSVGGDLARVAEIGCGAWPIGPVALRPGQFAVASQAERTIEIYALSDSGLAQTTRIPIDGTPVALVRSAEGAELHVLSRDGRLFTLDGSGELSTARTSIERATDLLAVPSGLWVSGQVPPSVNFLPGGEPGEGIEIPLPGIPRALLDVDLDRDGVNELVVAGGDEDLWVFDLLADGAPIDDSPRVRRFEAPGHVPTRLTAVDLDGDDDSELIGLHRYDTSYGVLGDLNSATARFAIRTSEYAGQSPFALACADVDGDQRPDLIVAGRDAQALSILSGTGLPLAKGKPPFYDAARVPVGTNPLFALGWRSTRNTRTRAPEPAIPSVVALLGAQAAIRLTRSVEGILQPDEVVPVGPSPRRAVAFGANSAGTQSLGVLCEPTDGSRLVLLAPTDDGGLKPQGEPIPIGRAADLAVASNAAPTLLASDPSLSAIWAVRPDPAGPPQVEQIPIPAPASALATHPSGWFVLGLLGESPQLVFGKGLPSAPPLTTAQASGRILGLAFGDADGAGLPDVFALVSRSADHKQAVVELWLGGEDGWSLATRAKAGLKPIQLATGDLDGDGLDDALIATQNDHQVQVLFTRDRGSRLEPGADFGAGLGCYSVALVDLTGNGVSDVVVANAFSADISVIYGVE